MARDNGFKADNFLDVAPPATHTVLEDFEQKMRSHADFKVKFTAADMDNNMYYTIREGDSEYKVLMPATELAGTDMKNIRRMVSISREYPVVVKSIDYATNTVIVSYQQALSVARDKLIGEIVRGLKEDRPMRTKARIDFIRETTKGIHFLELNIGGVGLKGYLFKDEWSTCYTSDIRSFAKVGDIIDVDIMGVYAPRSYKVGDEITFSKKVIFRCSRKNTISYNPWKGIEEKYPVGTTVSITCVSKDKTKFFARIEGLDELNALCVYPDTENFYIRVGGCYQAFVKKVDEQEKVIVLKPVRELS